MLLKRDWLRPDAAGGMRKIRAFIAAALLMAIFVLSAHTVTSGLSLKVDNGRFGFWFSPYKDLSYSALSDNISKDTVLVMGSSEFRHGRRTEYHPANAIRTENADLMTIGGPCNQILFHSIMMGSVENKLERRQVILLVSPTWFKKDGVNPVNYGTRFSESEYIRFMQNPDIDSSTKKYVAERSEKLLADNSRFRTKVSIINRYLADGKDDIISRMLFKAEEMLAFDRDRVSAAMAIRKISKKSDVKTTAEKISDEAFDMLAGQAEEESVEASDNPFEISDSSWKRNFSKTYRADKDAYNDKICIDSPEFGDLKAFLEVCSQTGLQAKLIIMPVNGGWFDYIGTGEKQRRETTDKIIKLAGEYGAETADLTVYEYEPFITKDVTHPWNKGWVLIDREIYDFCTGKQKG